MANKSITSLAQAVTPANSTIAPVIKETVYYTSKWGRVVIFNGDNYVQFATTCRFVLTAAGAWSIVQGNESAPESDTAAAKDHRERANNGIQIISSSVTESFINRLVPFLDTADLAGMWAELAKADRAKDDVYVINTRYQFSHERFNHTRETIRQYATRLEQYKTKLAGSSQPVTDTEILQQILFTLPADTPNWQMAKQWVIRDKLSLEQALITLQSHEASFQSDTAITATDTAATASDGRVQNRGRGSKRGRSQGRGRNRGRGQGAYRYHHNSYRDGSRTSSNKGDSDGKVQKGEIKCWLCQKTGHRQRDCKEYNKAREKAQTRIRDREESVNFATHVINESNYGTICYASSIERAYFGAAITDWILDSGATRHFTGVMSDIQTLKRWSTSRPVRIADQRTVLAIGYGEAVVGSLTLSEVWYVPEFGSIRMISVRALNENGIKVIFDSGVATGWRKTNKVFTAPGVQGLYLIKTKQQAYMSIVAGDTKTLSEAEIWHCRLAHTNYRDIERLLPVSKGMMVSKRVIFKGEHACEACLAGKMKESFTKKTDSRAEIKLRRLHADISGILPPSLRQYRYFLLVVDDATRIVWVRFMKSKETAEILPIIEQLKAEVERETGNDIVYFRVDNGRGEFGTEFKERMRILGIQVEPSPPYKHSLNGVVERMMGSVTVKARSMLQQAKLDTEFWCYAIEHAVYIKNRVPTAALPYGTADMSKAVTPFEAYKKAHPDLTKLRIFGATAYPINTLEKFPKKFDSRSKQGYIFIGMRGSTVWKLLNYKTFKVEEFADVKFDEYKFPAPTIIKSQPIEIPVAVTSRRKIENRLNQELQQEKQVEDTPARAVEQTQPTQKHGRTAREKNWTTFPKTQGFVPLPVIITETRLRERKPQAATAVNLAEDQEQVETLCRRDAEKASSGRRRRHQVAPENADRAVHCGSQREVNPQRNEKLRRIMRTEREVFSDSIMQAVINYNAVHLDTDSASLGAPVAPFEAITVAEAMSEDALNWKTAIANELKALASMNTFKIIKGNTESVKVISSRWVLRKKFRADGTIARRKARLVIRGFEQTYGVDYFATFASVIRYTTLRILLAKAAADDLEADHIDVNTAFLNPILEEDVYMEVPDFFDMIYPELKNQLDIYLKLNKALYGLKQAPRAWQKMVHAFFESIGLTASMADPSLYVGLGVYILLFVDDMLIIGDRFKVDHIKNKILKEWKSKDLGPVDTFVGFQIKRNRSRRLLHIHQSLYTQKLLERLSMHQCHPTYLPIQAGTVLKPDKNLLGQDEASLYRQIVGSALYLANNTRLDIAYAVGQLARFMAQPAKSHLRCAKQLLRYLNGTRMLGITYSNRLREGPRSYKLYSDATWGTENDRISFQGWVVVRYSGAVSWAAQRQKSTALSSMEAEIIASSEGAKEAAWLEKLLADFGERNKEGTEAFIPSLYCDNQGAIDLMHNPKFHAKAKHIDLRNMYIRNDMVSKNRLRVEFIPGADQPADILTKQLPSDACERHCRSLGMDTWFT